MYTLDWEFEGHEFWRDGVHPEELEAQVRALLEGGVEAVTVHTTTTR